MADDVGHDDARALYTNQDLLAALLSGELPDGTKVYPPSQIVAVDGAGVVKDIRCDRFTSALVEMPHSHWIIHEGRAFLASGIETLAAGASHIFTIEANGVFVHLADMECDATGGPVTIEIVEGPTITEVGATKAAVNRNRNSTRTSSAGLMADATISGGDVIKTILLAGNAQGSNRVPGNAGTDHEIMLKTDTVTAIRFTNIGSASIQLGYDLFWYEMGGE